MDSTAVNWNLTIDDFDSILDYADQGAWKIPDASVPDFVRSDKPVLRGTYHLTEKDTSVSLNFTGPSLYIYGGVGPTFGDYEISLDGSFTQRYSAKRDAYDNSTLLFSASNLTYCKHALTIRNVGPTLFSLDYVLTTVQLGPQGSTISNVTYDERDPALTYKGTWGHNEGPHFIGGGTTYSNGDGDSLTLTFKGSSVLILGDKKIDHGKYSVSLDGGPEEIYNALSTGCGPPSPNLTCEQQYPTIKYFASNLNSEQHVLVLKNIPGNNGSYFDFDAAIVGVPSKFAPRDLAPGPSPFLLDGGSGSNTTTTNGSKPPSSTGGSDSNQTGAADPTRSIPGSLLLFILLFNLVWTLRRR